MSTPDYTTAAEVGSIVLLDLDTIRLLKEDPSLALNNPEMIQALALECLIHRQRQDELDFIHANKPGHYTLVSNGTGDGTQLIDDKGRKLLTVQSAIFEVLAGGKNTYLLIKQYEHDPNRDWGVADLQMVNSNLRINGSDLSGVQARLEIPVDMVRVDTLPDPLATTKTDAEVTV